MSETENQPPASAGEAEVDEDNRIIKLKSMEGDTFEVPAKTAKLSQLVKNSIDDDDDDDEANSESPTVELMKVGSDCLGKVIEYCNHYSTVEAMNPITCPLGGDTLEEIVTQAWYRDFVKNVDQSMLFQMVTAANYMEIQPLLDLACLRVSIELMGKSAEEIRTILNIPKMTPEEEAKARADHRWIFED